MSEIKLIPCPFCGAPARSRYFGTQDDIFRIECDRPYGPPCCGMQIPKGAEDTLINRWNRRVPYTEEILNAERDKRYVVLPCQLGQKIWYISDGKIDYGFAKWFEADEKDGWTVVVANPPRGLVYLKFECFGKIAFLSHEEAETARLNSKANK